MLQPRQSDVPALFLFFVVLPVVLYILLGKWSEASKRKERISLFVEEPTVEGFTPEPMVTANAIPIVPLPTPAFRQCARCCGPATTRCSRCKSVRYCSGKCQIIHWRQGHKDNCWPSDSMSSSLKSDSAGFPKSFPYNGSFPQDSIPLKEQPLQERYQSNMINPPVNPMAFSAGAFPGTAAAGDDPCTPKQERRISEKWVSRKSTKEMLDGKDKRAATAIERNMNIADSSKEAYAQHKLRVGGFISSEGDLSENCAINGVVISDRHTDWRGRSQQNRGIKIQTNYSMYSTRKHMKSDEVDVNCSMSIMNGLINESSCTEKFLQRDSSCEMLSSNVNTGSRVTADGEFVKPAKCPKSTSRASRDQTNLGKRGKEHKSDESVARIGNSFAQGGHGCSSNDLMKVMGLKKSSRMSRQDTCNIGIGSYKKVEVLFPFEEFTRLFEQDVFELAPRGLLNCGNSCYANAVLQCLTCTKPLVMFLLSRTHSRACCLKNWCLLCELEQHVIMLKEAGGPLSPSRILSHIRRINCQIGDGSQEDAHEFLRLLVASMQSICLEEAGGESKVHPNLQETTFVQQTFGGRLRSMVRCLKCHHESERYENIMDLTLEIFGWVESLVDALTQFTNPEDLDGENMYRCGRCASYVRARKQLSIDEAPNILTIVLKRFQEGNYGKINKCISFPEMLDMVPFMTGSNDIPPLYILYGVVVHVDTLNASFSGHYVSYVKDLQGNWFRIDDSVVQPVPVSQVMSEGAYILFYKRSYPRAPRDYNRKAARKQAANPLQHSMSKPHRSSEIGQCIHRANNRSTPAMEKHAELIGTEFSDVTSSDWSLFTSSDEASFTSESTRDSFSATDYSDTCNVDPFYSKISPSQRTISCRMFSGSKAVTRYVSEQQGYILDSDETMNPFNDVQLVGIMRQVSLPFNEAFLSNSGYQNFVNYESSSRDGFLQTFGNCQL